MKSGVLDINDTCTSNDTEMLVVSLERVMAQVPMRVEIPSHAGRGSESGPPLMI